ncbi:hypothetical protein [Rubrivirga sp. IMCC45206]|uniref:hypothetical protein n=1 Tax=Rubrivirga sp. IMCC45206 TaxID=3391614 RepID=UPI00398FCC94
MTDLHANRLDMQRTVLDVLDAHADAWAPVPVMQTYRDALAGLVATAEKLAKDQAKTSKPATATKGALRTKVADKSWRLSQAIKAWATANDRPDVAEAVHLSKDEFNNLRDIALYTFSGVVVDEARKHLPAPEEDPTTKLGAYGVTAAFVDTLDAEDDAFGRHLAGPQGAIAARKGATRELAATVSKAQKLLKNEVDGTVDFLALEQPAFAQAYADARIIVDRGRGPGEPDEPPADADAG